jgi:hypothetical protein
MEGIRYYGGFFPCPAERIRFIPFRKNWKRVMLWRGMGTKPLYPTPTHTTTYSMKHAGAWTFQNKSKKLKKKLALAVFFM